MSMDDYLGMEATSIWSDKLKKTMAAFNLNAEAPIHLDHLAVHIVAYLKVYGEGNRKFLDH
jgi:hypothetical protein